MNMRERFEKEMEEIGVSSVRDESGIYVDSDVRFRWYGWMRALKMMYPPRPTDAQLDSAGVRLVGEEPVMVMPGELYPTHYHGPSWGVVEHGKAVPEWGYISNETPAPVFVWRVERKEAGK